ncbi:uncharacterized protein LOC115622119 isoform X2 [Scaptodrosophila lebanonensis]|nr:uncharacterized protein LOC115622119 isoform X2 [Scaptodrosophila lebanonensis]
MSPRHGTLAPRASTKIKVELLPDQSISHLGRDRIQVMCIPAPSTQIDKHATQDFWRHNSCYNWYIENHKLCCYQLRPGESPPPIPPSKLRQSLLHFGSETTSATGSANRATGATRVMGKRWR